MERNKITPGSFVELTDKRIGFIPESSDLRIIILDSDNPNLESRPLQPREVKEILGIVNNKKKLTIALKMNAFNLGDSEVKELHDQMFEIIDNVY